MNAPWLRKLVLIIGALGTLLFGGAFLASLLDPLLVEEIGRELIRIRIEKKVGEHIDAIDGSFLMREARRLNRAYAERIENNQRLLREKAPARIAALIAQMQNRDCECRRKIEGRVREGLERGIADAKLAMHGLDELIRGQYQSLARKITREFRIFTGINALVFLALVGAALARPAAGVHLVPAMLVLLVANLATAYFYLFAQNWLATIVFGDYVGWTYLAYLACACAPLADIVFNRGRITSVVLRCVFDAAGSGAVITPC